MRKLFTLLLAVMLPASGAIVQLATSNADRDLTSQVTVLTDTPDATSPMLCQGLINFGDGTKNLDGTGGDFELTVTVGGQTIEPDPQTITFSTATRTAVWTTQFPVPANTEVILKAKSPNAGDSDVDVTAYLYQVDAVDIVAINGGLTSGNNATLKLAQLDIQSQTAGQPAIKAIGNTTAAGAEFTGGTSGAGVKMSSGASATSDDGALHLAGSSGGSAGLLVEPGTTGGIGIEIDASGGSDGIKITANSDGINVAAGANGDDYAGNGGDALRLEANGSGCGIQSLGGSTDGHGIYAKSGASTGDGIKVEATESGHAIEAKSSAGHGFYSYANSGNGKGIFAEGYGAGEGMRIEGGTSARGLYCLSSYSSGIRAEGPGEGILADGSGASGAGFKATGSGSGKAIDAAEIDTIYAKVDGLNGDSLYLDVEIASAVADSVPSAAVIADSVLAQTIDTGFDLEDATKRMLSVLDGDVNGTTSSVDTIFNKAGSAETIHDLSTDNVRTVTDP